MQYRMKDINCPGHEPSITSCSWVSWPTHTSTPCDAGAARSRAGIFQRELAQPDHLPTCAPDSIYNHNIAPWWQAVTFKTCNPFSTEMNSSVRRFSVLSPAKSDLQMLPLLTKRLKKKNLLGLSCYTSKFSLDKAKPALLISNLRQCPQVFLRRKKPEWK